MTGAAGVEVTGVHETSSFMSPGVTVGASDIPGLVIGVAVVETPAESPASLIATTVMV